MTASSCNSGYNLYSSCGPIKMRNIIHIFLLLLCLGFPSTGVARTHLHRGSSSAESPVFIRGRVVTSSVHTIPKSDGSVEIQDMHDGSQVVDFRVKLMKDVIVCEELEEDGVSIDSCSQDARSRTASVTLVGRMLDMDDYKRGNVFSIGVDDWEKNCGRVETVDGIDKNDDYLFYLIENVRAKKNRVVLKLRIIPGHEVVPEVEFSIDSKPGAAGAMPKNIMFDDHPSFGNTVRYLEGSQLNAYDQYSGYNETLLTVSRPEISAEKTINVSPGVKLTVGASLQASFENFKLKRSLKVELSWTQALEASVTGTLNVDLKRSGAKMGDVFRKPIPGIGFSSKIPFVGRVRAGAFGIVQWMLEGDMSGKMRASLTASYVTEHRVEARLFSPKLSAEMLSAAGSGAGGSTSISFSDVSNAEFNGFAGARPALGVQLSLGSKGIEGNVGAKIGVQATTVLKKSPFPAFTGTGLKVGKCTDCHLLRGAVSVEGKELTSQLVKSGNVEKEDTLSSELFSVPLGTLCAIPARCEL